MTPEFKQLQEENDLLRKQYKELSEAVASHFTNCSLDVIIKGTKGNNKKPSVHLTKTEGSLIKAVIEKVYDIMEYDKDINSFIDNGNFLLTISKADYNRLKTIIDKL